MAAKIFQCCYLPMLNIALLCFFLRCSLSAPIEPVSYANFVRDMNSSKCSSPDQIKLPLNASTSESDGNNLSDRLKVCQNLETVQHRKEARYLCQEIFDNLKVILCPPISAKVLAANLTLSKDVCKDIESLKETVPEDKVMLKTLTDIITCELMCDGEYESTCQVLLWSHQLQQKNIISPQKEAKENSLQAGLEAVADNENNIAEDQKNADQEVQKSATSDQKTSITGSAKEQRSNDLLSAIQKGTTVKQDQKNQVPEQQGNPGPNVPNPPQIQPKEKSLNNIPMNQNNLTGSNSLNAGNKGPEVKDIKSNELPEQDIESNNAGPQEQEDPHDQHELPHNELDTNENQPQAPDNTLPEIKVKDKLPNQPKEESPDKTESNHQDKLPKIPVDEEHAEPHDAEEAGEETLEETEQKISPETDTQKSEVDEPNQSNEAVQPKTTAAKTTIDKAATTQEQSSEGTTKKLITSTSKGTTLNEKTSPVVKPQSTPDQKTSELPSSVQSQESSSLELSTPKDSSVSTAILEEMELDKGVHEDREPDPYNGLFEPKNREPLPNKPNEEEVPKMDMMRPREPSDDISSRNTYNRQPEVMPIFPDQEDGHFFFYFLSIVLILMGGYLLFHNKQKIIALIVEGRHERRRRSHGVGYKKLETK